MAAKFLALVLARGGSKGIPKKNIKLLGGKPLLAYTIEAAKASRYLDRVILSTEDQEIAETGRRYGAEVPFMRPAELATDQASSIDTIIHALNWLRDTEGYLPDYTVLLQPTSPFRTAADIDGAIEKLLQCGAASLVSLCEADAHPFWLKKIVDDRVVPFTEEGAGITRRQDLPAVYNLNGAIYIAETELMIREKTFYVGTTAPYVMSKESSVDLDDMVDWLVAEALLKERR